MPLILLVILFTPVLLSAQDALPTRAQRVLTTMTKELNQAEADLTAARQRHAQARLEARREAVADLERLAERERDIPQKALLYKHALAILPEEAAGARTFFTAIGTLDQVLAEIENDNPVAMPATGGGVDLLAAGNATYDPLSLPVAGAPLSDIDPLSVSVGWATLGRGQLPGGGGGPLTVQGVDLPQGLCAHPPSDGSSQVVYAVPPGATALVGGCAVHDRWEAQFRTPLTYRIHCDGREVWRSPPIEPGTQALVPFAVPVVGVSRVTLVIDCPGNYSAAVALWVNPAFR